MATDKQKQLALDYLEKGFGQKGEVINVQRPEIWKPDKKGDAVVGFVDSITDGKIEDKPVKNIVIRTGKAYIQLPVHSVLTRLIGKAEVGDGVYIVFKGEVKGKGPRPFKDYDVSVMKNPKGGLPF